MKAGIVTFASAHNYGALLQAYASQKYLENQGFEVNVINYRPKVIDDVYRLYRIKKTNSLPRKVLRKAKSIVKTKTVDRWKITRYNNFESFISDTLHTTKPYVKKNSLKAQALDKYDVLIAGSDQIWNTDLTKGFDNSYFLEFGKKDAIRIAYAVSLGREDIDYKYEEFYKRYLKNFDYISVREKSMVPVFSKLTPKNIDITVDPTLLLDKKDFDELKMESAYAGKDYIYAHFIGADDKVAEFADKLAEDLGCPVVHNFPRSVVNNELACHYNERVEQIISMVENARFIVSNSFHLTVLAIIYNKPFITVPHKTRPERMKNLLEMTGLENHLIEDVRIMPDLDSLKVDWQDVSKRIEECRKASVEFLDKALFSPKPKETSNYFKSKDRYECYNCTLCRDVCPVGAITMQEDQEGFVYPEIDKEKCIDCKLCEKKCIYRNSETITGAVKPKVYAAVNADEKVLMQSASGGMITPMYEYVIGQGGSVVGVCYDSKMRVTYAIADNLEDCAKFRGSKYVAPYFPENIRKDVKALLEQGKPVLFTGNPCQCAAMRKYLGKDYDNLILCEIICYGVPSAKVFNRYIKHLGKKYKSPVVNFQFRDKSNGWANPTIKVTLKNGKELYEIAKYNNYNRAFHNNAILRPACYNCQFSGGIGNSDFVVGDYWGIEKVMPEIAKGNKGVSLLMVNTQKGADFLEKIKSSYKLYESNYKTAYSSNHRHPSSLTIKRIDLMREIDDMNIDKLLAKYNQFKTPTGKNKEKINKSI